MNRTVFSALALATLVSAASVSVPVWAQYKIVGPDGKVTYTDRAPDRPAAQSSRSNGNQGPSSDASLPYELQRVVNQYPVTLYTGSNCAPCDSGRQMLKSRGIPFVEKSVTTPDDSRALLRVESTERVPLLRIGQKQVQGYGQSDWSAYLDAAGYPVKSTLPSSYTWPTAAPLAPMANKPTAPSATADNAIDSSPSSPAPAAGARTGFRF